MNYMTEPRNLVKVGDIIEFPSKKHEYTGDDLVGVKEIYTNEFGVEELLLSDGTTIEKSGSNFWMVRLVAERIQLKRMYNGKYNR